MTHLTETQRIEDRIVTALATIRREWDHMLPTAAPAQRIGGGSKAAGILGDNTEPTTDTLGRKHWPADHVDTDRDIDPATRLVSLRREVRDVLNGWSRVVMEDRPVTKALPDGLSVSSMATFLERHARWVSGHEAAQDMADELEALARRVHAVTQPQRREWINLGSCPLEIEAETDDGLAMVTCGGQVRAWPRAEDRDGEVMARCRRCGIEAVPSWWEARMFDDPELRVLLTAEEVVSFVHRAYGKVIKAGTVRQWDKRGTIEPAGHDDKGRRLYARDALVWALDLQERREAMG